MKEQRKNKIVYFTLTSAAEAPVGFVIRKAGLPPLFFPFFCFFLPLPLLARLAPLWWSCGSSEGYHPNTKHHGKSKLWLVSGDGPCRHGGSRRVHILRSAATLSCKKVEGNPLVMFTSHQIASPTLVSACWSKCLFYQKSAGSCQTSGGLTNRWLNPGFVCIVEYPDSQEELQRGLWCQQGVAGHHVAPHVGSG